jgi:hypothetical protein
MTLNVIAHNLGRWVNQIGLGAAAVPITTKTLRTRLLSVPGRIPPRAAGAPCISLEAGRGRRASRRCSPTCVRFPGRACALAVEPWVMTASRHLCPTPADECQSRPLVERACCGPEDAIRAPDWASGPPRLIQRSMDDRPMLFGGSGLN